MRRPVARAFAIVCCAAPMVAVTLAAQGAERDQQCVAELLEEVEGMTAEEAAQEPCFQLANALESRVSAPATLQMMLERTPPRDFQSRAMGNAGTAGAPSQAEAVPSVQPLALAGGSLAAVGSEGGTDAIAAFTINPAILFGAQDDAHAAELTRLLDLTVLAPVNDLDRDEDGKIDYWGLRARINVTGPGAGKHLRQAVTAFAQRVQRSAIVAASLDTVLRETPNFEKCVAAFRADSVFPETVTAGCGRRLEIAPDPGTLERFRAALAQARDSADAYYLGVDLRLDQGDPTLGATPTAAGTTLFAGLAYGRKILSPELGQPTFGLRARLGVQHVSLDDVTLSESDRNNTAIDGAVAFDFTYPYQFQPLRLAAGLEFRAGDPPVADREKDFRTNFLQARLSLDVPITAANSLSISFAGPLTGEEKPILTINGNWQLLLSGLSALGRAEEAAAGR